MGQRACIAMYPFEGIRDAYQRLWSAVHEHAPWTPDTLGWTDEPDAVDLPATWTDPRYVVGQACGWPVATTIGADVRVIGAFEYAIPEAAGHRYRTTIVATRQGPLAAFADAPAAANSPDSLSGWISLNVALHGTGTALAHRPVTFTGAHVHSLRLLQAGGAEVASIDSVTLAHLRRLHPEVVDGLHVVGQGPLVPSVALITPATTTDAQVAHLRSAFAAAVDGADPAVLDLLLVRRFVPLDNAAYDECLALVTDELRPVQSY